MGRKKKQDFFSDDCGEHALLLAARGSALIAEILRLAEHIPSVFLDPQSAPQYENIICDFSYFSKQVEFEKAITDSAELLELDEEFKETHMELLIRFFKLFRGVLGYVSELNRFVTDIREGMYISHSMESVLVHPDGKQLMCEIHYLLGVMLLLMDVKFGEKVREYLIISYIRYRGASDQQTVEVAGLFRSTGFHRSKKPPNGYPEKYFARVQQVDTALIENLVGRLRSDDVYNMAYHYPAPEHRSTSLANQAQMLFVLLFFCPHILQEQKQVMREITDKHFVDNWVIAFYMGFTVDLLVYWRPFKSAYAAITTTVEIENVAYHTNRLKSQMHKLSDQISDLLIEGVLTEQYVLDNIYKELLPRVREANVILRYFILHMTRRQIPVDFIKAYEIVNKSVQENDVLNLLLKTAQLEFILRAMFTQLLREKRNKWDETKNKATTKMIKLSEYFSGKHVLSDNVRVEQLEDWFENVADKVEVLSYSDGGVAGRKINKLIKALEHVQEFHHIDENIQVKQFIEETRHHLLQMLRITNIERKVLVTIGTVGDLSYAWEIFARENFFVGMIQEKIKNEPVLVLQMRSTFLKMATMLELPCTRIDQAADNDPALTVTLENVSDYYSTDLVQFVRKVLHVIPSSIFKVIRQIMLALNNDLQECPTKVARQDLKQMSQLELRNKIVEWTSEISLFASGILAMESTLVGVIQVDPHQLLEDGIRQELVSLITHELDRQITIDTTQVLVAGQFDEMMHRLGKQLTGIRNAFEFVQDYVNVHGLRIWLEEFFRIVNFNVEMECNIFLTRKLYHWKSRFQSDVVPIPYLGDPKGNQSYSFLGRIGQHLLLMTRRLIYVPALGAWYDWKDGSQVVGEQTFSSIVAAIGVQGLAALDRLFCFNIARETQRIVVRVSKGITTEEAIRFFEGNKGKMLPTSGLPTGTAFEWYRECATAIGPTTQFLAEAFHRMGRMQLLRKLISSELQSRCKLESGALFFALRNTNNCLMHDLHTHYNNPTEHPLPGKIVPELDPFLEATGFSDAPTKIYVTSKSMPHLPYVLMTMLANILGNFTFNSKYGCLVPTNASLATPFFVDASAVISATLTLLKQFHSDYSTLFFGLLSQLIRVAAVSEEGTTQDLAAPIPDGPSPAAQLLAHFMERFADNLKIPVEELHQEAPNQCFYNLRNL